MKALIAAAALLAAPVVAAAQPVQTYVEAPGPLGPLKGTMLAPAAAGAPVVLILPGSGPTDRDGDNSLGVKAASYRLLAEGLAEKGVATVRIDKRGMFASAAAVTDPNKVTIEEYAADAHAWIKVIRKTTGAKCVWILGHSEGGLIALAAAREPEDVCGLILVSAAGRPFGELLREQLHANPANAPLLAPADSAIDALAAGRHPDAAALPAPLQRLFGPAVQDLLIDEMRLDPAKLIAAYPGPVLIVQGARDLQISVADAQRLKAADPQARLVILPEMNHVLKAIATDDRQANVAAYVDPSLPIAPGVVEAVADFVKASATGR
jgi:pimeloyl-ACP methyl ester carboxylesterase